MRKHSLSSRVEQLLLLSKIIQKRFLLGQLTGTLPLCLVPQASFSSIMKFVSISFSLLPLLYRVEGFLPQSADPSPLASVSPLPSKSSHMFKTSSSLMASSRRSFLEESAAVSSLALIGAATIISTPQVAQASGGATAGGAYLLSAKQRYNDRVKAGVVGFLTIGASLESGDIASVRTFFTDESTGSWQDFSAAGYLLANAFRRNSSAAPDTLPAVKVSWMNERLMNTVWRKERRNHTNPFR